MPRMSKTIKIYSDTKTGISPIFVKANRILILRYQHELDKIKEDSNKTKKLRKLWKQEFNAHIVEDRQSKKWRDIKFENTVDLTVFLLKILE